MALTVAQLLASGRLERVPPDELAAQARLERARQHLVTAAALIGVDNDVAYTSLYDGARKSITAHMLASGVRAPGKAGAHEAVGIYAAESIAGSSHVLEEFQRLRRRRNKSEYDDIVIGDSDVRADLEAATAVVDAVAASMP